jgi:hypothetical protein
MSTRSACSLSVCALVLAAGTAVTARQASTRNPKPTEDYAQEAVVIEQARTVLRFEQDGTARREIYMRLRAQSEAGVQQWGQLLFGYNSANERPDILFVRVKKPDGTVIATPSDSVQDLSSPVQRVAPVYTDFRQTTSPFSRCGQATRSNSASSPRPIRRLRRGSSGRNTNFRRMRSFSTSSLISTCQQSPRRS